MGLLGIPWLQLFAEKDHQDLFQSLEEAPAPAALVEVGFLSHQQEGLLLADPLQREKIARAIARGIDQYVREVRKAALVVEAE